VSVRYNPVIGIVLIVLGVINIVLAVWLIQVGGTAGASLFLGPFIAILGLLQLNRTYFEFDQRTSTITMKALIGPAKREFGGAKGDLLRVEGERIMRTRADGRTKKVPVSRFYARGDQWRAVLSLIQQSPVTGPAQY
jgi:hypothetical protein